MQESDILNPSLTHLQRRQIAKEWLRRFQREKLPELRREILHKSRFYDDVTIVAYSFPKDAHDFDFIEFAIRYSWQWLGKLKTVIIADRMTERLEKFKVSTQGGVDVQIEPSLIPGDIMSMSSDCIERLYRRFNTPYCLIVQDDGFPLNRNLGDFLGKYDFIGAPTCRDVPAQYLVDIFRCSCLNGGFSLRSKKICEAVSEQWRFFKHFVRIGSEAHAEDVFYTKTACLNLSYRIRFRFAPCKVARLFSMPDFDGVVDIRSFRGTVFGSHGHTAMWQMLSSPTI